MKEGFAHSDEDLKIFTSLSAENAKTFLKGMFVDLSGYLDEETDQDSEFLQTIMDDLESQKSHHVIFDKIVAYASTKNNEVDTCIQELLKIKNLERFKKLFLDENLLVKETTKERIRHHLDVLNPHTLSQVDKAEPRDELVQLMIAEFNNTEPDFNGYFANAQKYMSLIENETPKEYEQRVNKHLFNEIDKIIEHSFKNRLQIIVRTGAHYLVLDIDKEKKSCFIIDAAADVRQERFLQITNYSDYVSRVSYIKAEHIPDLERNRVTKIILQCDEHSCSIFATDHARQVATIKDVHDFLTQIEPASENTNLCIVKWTELPPEMVKNSQSTQVLSWYKNNAKSSIEKLDKFTHNNSKSHGFEETRKEITKRAYQLCDNKKESEIRTMIESTELPKNNVQSYGVS